MRRSTPRRGATLVLVVFVSSILLAMAVISIDVAHMQLVRTELRAATDAAAKAATEVLSRAGSESEARQRAIEVAALNTVGGAPLELLPSEIQLGRSTRSQQGSWQFQAGALPATAVRIDTTLSGERAPSLLLGRILGVSHFVPKKIATASYAEHDVVLCVDRSHSMCFDLSGVDFVYPPDVPTTPAQLAYPPHPTESRWAYLALGVNSFIDVAQRSSTTQHVGLVTWASDIEPGSYETTLTGQTSPATAIDVPLGSNHTAVRTAINARSSNVMLGATNMAAGMQAALTVLAGPSSRPNATKTMILMTDGLWNQGTNPVDVALEAKAAGVTVYTITFLQNTNQNDMEQIATITGGRHFHANNGPALVEAFEELATTLPVVMTD